MLTPWRVPAGEITLIARLGIPDPPLTASRSAAGWLAYSSAGSAADGPIQTVQPRATSGIVSAHCSEGFNDVCPTALGTGFRSLEPVSTGQTGAGQMAGAPAELSAYRLSGCKRRRPDLDRERVLPAGGVLRLVTGVLPDQSLKDIAARIGAPRPDSIPVTIGVGRHYDSPVPNRGGVEQLSDDESGLRQEGCQVRGHLRFGRALGPIVSETPLEALPSNGH
jgi:hypothetical protein